MNKVKFILIIFVLSASIALAKEQVDLSEHGVDLMKASFPIRYKFENVYHKTWLRSTLDQRKDFLTNWHIEENEAIKKARTQAVQEAKQNRLIQKEKEIAEKIEQNRIRTQERADREKEKKLRAEKREFDKKVREEQRALQRMQSDKTFRRP